MLLVLNITTLCFGIVLFLSCFSNSGKKQLQLLAHKSWSLWLMPPTIMFSVFTIYTALTGGGIGRRLLIVFILLFAPTLLTIHAEAQRKFYFSWEDYLSILILWGLYDFRLLPGRSPGVKPILDWPLYANYCGFMTIYCFGFLRSKLASDLGNYFVRPQTNISQLIERSKAKVLIEHLSITTGLIVACGLLTIPIGYGTGFLVFQDYVINQPNTFMSALVVCKKVFGPSGLFKTFGYILTVAFMEEAIFRGVIQDRITKIFRSEWVGITFAAVLFFGGSHFNNPSIGFKAEWWPWDWNGLYIAMAGLCGLFYGVCRKYTTLFWAIVLHAIVDVTWYYLSLKP